MAVKRIVSTSFWTDGKVDEFSPEDKYFMLYLLTNPFTTQLGIYEISIKQVAFQLGYSVDAVNVLLDRFENKYQIIKFSPNTMEIAIKNYLKHSIVKGGAPVRDCLIKELKRVKDKSLILWVFSSIENYENLNDTVKKLIAEYKENNVDLYYCNEKEKRTKKENEIDNDNENENEVSYPDSYNESLTNRSFPTLFGKYHNVKLSQKEYTEIKEAYPLDYEKKIDRLSTYMKQTGKSYKSHFATIMEWAKEDAQKPKNPDSRRYVRNERIFRGEQTTGGSVFDELIVNDYIREDEPKQLPTEEEVEEFAKQLKTDYPHFSDARYESAVESFRNGTWK